MAEAKKGRNKIYAVGVVGFLTILSILYVISAPVYLYIVVYMWFGFIYGVLQQYGRFCFASAWRDLIMVKVPRMFVGIMMGLIVLSVISAWLFVKFPTFFHPAPLGWNELAGGLLFGLGMVFAGGCATGSLYKTGEGNMISLTVLLSLSFAQAVLVALPFWDPFVKDYISGNSAFVLADKVYGTPAPGEHHTLMENLIANSLLNVIILAVVLLIAVYIIVIRSGFLKRRAAAASSAADGGEVKMGFKDEVAGFWHMISSSKRTTIAAIGLGVVAAIQLFTMSSMRDNYDFGHPPGNDQVTGNFGQVMTGATADGSTPPASWKFEEPRTDQVSKQGTMFDPGYWYITTQEAMAAGWVLDAAGAPMDGNVYFGEVNGLPSPWLSPALLLSFGLILGASFLALWNREFKWKFPTRELFLYAVMGGTIMGIGSRVALGCNIGAFYTRAAFGDPGGWLFFIGMGVGAYISAKLVNYIANRKMADMDFDIEL
ncbi:MAG: YeeE/YedE family protein [Actinobacteria bacterium]|nr:YeeE/YedE family protein [Actinomycetota bacterium]